MKYIITNDHLNLVIDRLGNIERTDFEKLIRYVLLTYTEIEACAEDSDGALTRGQKASLTKLKKALNCEELNKRAVMYMACGKYKMAEELFLAAAENGEAIACRNLCYMYEFGVGVPQDSIEAESWREKASLTASDRVHDKIMEMLKA